MQQIVPLAAGVAADPPAEAPPFPRLLTALGGLFALGIVTGLGTGTVSGVTGFAPAGLVVGAGSIALATPPLVVAHQLLQLRARPDEIAAVLARGLARLGQLAGGLVPLVLLFAATSGLAPILAPLALYGAGALALSSTSRELIALESGSGVEDLARAGRMGLLVVGWAGLVVLIALRLSVDVGRFALGA